MKYYLTQEGKELIKEYMGPVERGVQMWGKTLMKNPDSQQQRSTAQKVGSQAQAKRVRDIKRAEEAKKKAVNK